MAANQESSEEWKRIENLGNQLISMLQKGNRHQGGTVTAADILFCLVEMDLKQQFSGKVAFLSRVLPSLLEERRAIMNKAVSFHGTDEEWEMVFASDADSLT